ncbi:MAG: hypothetical protein WCA38_08135 [Candidatus Acidiferrales bacterium]
MLEQPPQPEQKTPHTLRNMWLVFGAVVAIVALYTAYTFWARWEENSDLAAKQKAEQSEERRDEAQKAFDNLGGNEFKIMGFYATPGLIHRGDTVQMCYGVSNTKSVKLDPPDANVWPSADRCMQVSPKKTTTYTLTADDGKGNSKTATLTIEVK